MGARLGGSVGRPAYGAFGIGAGDQDIAVIRLASLHCSGHLLPQLHERKEEPQYDYGIHHDQNHRKNSRHVGHPTDRDCAREAEHAAEDQQPCERKSTELAQSNRQALQIDRDSLCLGVAKIERLKPAPDVPDLKREQHALVTSRDIVARDHDVDQDSTIGEPIHHVIPL